MNFFFKVINAYRWYNNSGINNNNNTFLVFFKVINVYRWYNNSGINNNNNKSWTFFKLLMFTGGIIIVELKIIITTNFVRKFKYEKQMKIFQVCYKK